MILPSGYVRLKDNLGLILRRTRIMMRCKQAVVADDAGISRGTLSKIEKGRVPRPQVLDRLMFVLELDWANVADTGTGTKFRPFLEGFRGGKLIEIGRDIQRRRKDEGKSLNALSALLGLSVSTLSRLERGELPRSRVFQDLAGFESKEFNERPFKIVHPKLAAFLD